MKVGCFKDEADLARYRDHSDDMDLSVDEVFDILAKDLVKRGLLDPANPLPRSPTADNPELYTLQDLCLDTYARPPSAEIVDFSYRCAPKAAVAEAPLRGLEAAMDGLARAAKVLG